MSSVIYGLGLHRAHAMNPAPIKALGTGGKEEEGEGEEKKGEGEEEDGNH